MEIDRIMGISIVKVELVEIMEIFSLSPSGQGRDLSQSNSLRRPQSFQPRSSPFR